jgi:hypothetical protein
VPFVHGFLYVVNCKWCYVQLILTGLSCRNEDIHLKEEFAVLYLKLCSVISILRLKLTKCNSFIMLLDKRESDLTILNIVDVYVAEQV